MADKAIKSVRRIFEILELFDKVRRPLTAKEVADELGYPLASAHALMKSMHELGYADFNFPKWAYIPSRKFSVLSEWLADFLDRETRILECMDALNEETKETINLSRLVGGQVKIVHGVECMHAVGVSVKVGTLMPATQSLTGITALASHSDKDLSTFFDRLEHMESGQFDTANRDLIDIVRRELESRGSVCRNDLFIQGIGAVCVPVQTQFSKELMVIGVVGPSDRISRHEEEHRRALKRVMESFDVKCQYKLRNRPKTA